MLHKTCYAALCYAIVSGLNIMPMITMTLATEKKAVADGWILTSGSSCRENNKCGIYFHNNQQSSE